MKQPALLSEISRDVYLDAVRGLQQRSYTYHARLLVQEEDGRILADTYYNPVDLLLMGGSMSYDRLAETRASGNVEVEVLTEAGMQYVNPLRQYRLQPFVGIETDDYIVWIPLGVMNSSGIRHLVGRSRDSARVSLLDYSARYRDHPWKEVYDVSGGPTYDAAIAQILNDRANGFTPVIVGSVSQDAVPDPLIYHAGHDPWAAVWKLAQSVGGEVFHDRYGTVVLQAVKKVGQFAPHGETSGPRALVLKEDPVRNIVRREIFNGVICQASAPWLLFPIRGEVWDDDPLSETYRLGPFGERPKHIEDPIASSQAQCDAAAQAEYDRIAGIRQTLDLSMLKDPSLEVGGFISAVGEEFETSGTYQIDTLTISLETLEMRGTGRLRS